MLNFGAAARVLSLYRRKLRETQGVNRLRRAKAPLRSLVSSVPACCPRRLRRVGLVVPAFSAGGVLPCLSCVFLLFCVLAGLVLCVLRARRVLLLLGCCGVCVLPAAGGGLRRLLALGRFCVLRRLGSGLVVGRFGRCSGASSWAGSFGLLFWLRLGLSGRLGCLGRWLLGGAFAAEACFVLAGGVRASRRLFC